MVSTQVVRLFESGKKESAASFVGKKLADNDVCVCYGAMYGNEKPDQ